MNERIQELISAYLHRGSTPEQERELFDACSRNPETAELLRQHLVLSLRLHNLRDEVAVPAELRNSVLRRINALEAQGAAAESRTARPAPVPIPRRFGWAHLLGTGVAGAAVVFALWNWTDTSDSDITQHPIAVAHDTVTVVRTDTITQFRNVERPVYIVRDIPPAPKKESSREADTPQPVPQTATQTESGLAVILPEDRKPSAPDRSETDGTPAERAPLLADIQSSGTREEKTQSYLEQYTSMLVTVESVQLSTKDRLH